MTAKVFQASIPGQMKPLSFSKKRKDAEREQAAAAAAK